MIWSEILSAITDTVDVIGKLAKNIKDAVASGRSIYDTQKLRTLNNNLTAMLGVFASLNGLKGENLKGLADYLAKDPTAPKWPAIQAQWRDISEHLQAVLVNLEGQHVALVQGAGLGNASDLGAALRQQARIYRELPEMVEPATDADRHMISQISSKLAGLVDEVRKLEGSIKSYLDKHPR